MSNQMTRDAIAARRNGGDPWQQNQQSNGRRQQASGGGYRNRSTPPVPTEPVIPPLARRRPTGAVPWPFILIEGGEKTGKVWDMITLSASPKVGDCYLLDLSEGGADEYGTIPGANYWVVEHDGSWRSLMGQIRAIRREAQDARERGDKPVCLFIDSGTLIWAGLSQWADQCARRSPSGQRALQENPDAEVTITVTHWNAANKRWRDMMTLLLTFPGIVVMSARGKHVAEIDDRGRPVEGSKVYKVEGQKDLAYDATVWVRKLRDGGTEIVGARSVHAGIRPGGDQPKPVNGVFSLEWLIFDVLRCDPDRAHVRDLKDLDGDVGEAHEDHERAKAAAAARVDPADRVSYPSRPPRPGRPQDRNPAGEVDDDGEGTDFGTFASEVAEQATTRHAIRSLWNTARDYGWLDLPIDEDATTTRSLLMQRAAALESEQSGSES